MKKTYNILIATFLVAVVLILIASELYSWGVVIGFKNHAQLLPDEYQFIMKSNALYQMDKKSWEKSELKVDDYAAPVLNYLLEVGERDDWPVLLDQMNWGRSSLVTHNVTDEIIQGPYITIDGDSVRFMDTSADFVIVPVHEVNFEWTDKSHLLYQEGHRIDPNTNAYLVLCALPVQYTDPLVNPNPFYAGGLFIIELTNDRSSNNTGAITHPYVPENYATPKWLDISNGIDPTDVFFSLIVNN